MAELPSFLAESTPFLMKLPLFVAGKLRLSAAKTETEGGTGEDARGNVVVIVKEVSVKPEAWKRLGGREGNYAGTNLLVECGTKGDAWY